MAAINFPDSPSVNDVFTAGTSTWKWTGVAWETVGFDGASSVAELTDVELITLANNQILLYNSTSSKWKNVDTDVLTGANYDVLDGGSADSMYLVTVNGGDANG
jgi:hypothetical protein